MLKKNVTKITKILIIALLIMTFNITTVNAEPFHEVFNGADKFIEVGNSKSNINIDERSLETVSSLVYNILFVIGIALIVIIGVVLGIQFMIASAEDKAKVKESLVPYFVGSIVIMGAFGIWKLCIQIFSNI